MAYVQNVVLLALIGFYLYLAPFTKVEESFNIQAIYDIFNHGFENLEAYDHNEFPGAVKRSFVGPVVIATACKYLRAIAYKLVSSYNVLYTKSQMYNQILVRCFLGVANGLSLIRLKSSVNEACSKSGKPVGYWFGLLLFTQFHIVFYASHPLPNFIVLPIVNIALGKAILGDIDMGLAMLIFCSVVFRIELVAFTGVLTLVCLYNRQTSIVSAMKHLTIGGLLGLVLTAFMDKHFWQTERYVFPEVESLFYNVIEGKSSNWGVEPIYTYFTKYLVSIFLTPIVPILALPGLFDDLVNYRVYTIRSVVIASFGYICVMSLLPHKELRFIIYAVPGITMAAATTVSKLTSSKYKVASMLIKLFILCLSLATLLASLFKGYVSSLNYPGGVALQNLNAKLLDLDTANYGMSVGGHLTVHLDVPACMTGASLFGQLDNKQLDYLEISYDKTEDESKLADNDYEIWRSFQYVITDLDLDDHSISDEEMYSKLPPVSLSEWYKIDVISGYKGINRQAILKLFKDIKKDPVHFAYLIIADIKSLEFKILGSMLEDVISMEPKLFTYERMSLV